MAEGQGSASIVDPPPPRGTCPGCGQEAGGERCVHCGVAARVGPYRVRKVLGQRGASRTYLAEDVDGLVVLKELSFSTEPDPAILQAFHQEARMLQGLAHPRIPRYLDMLQLGVGADLRLYLAQEFIEGTSLEAELSGRRHTELEARELARHLLELLRYLQGRTPPVFHGDLKPANLIRRPDGALFLVDFGGAWVSGGAEPDGSRYLPPEQREGELDATTDLFALGVTLVDALSWKPAWRVEPGGVEGALAAHVDVSPRFRELLARLMATEPELRFASADEALRELEAPEPASPLLPRSRKGAVALGAGAALLLFGAGVLTGRATLQPLAEQAPRPPSPFLGVPSSLHQGSPSPARVSKILGAGTPAETREERAPLHVPLGCDFARGGRASESHPQSRGSPDAAFDHEVRTFWQNFEPKGAWLQVDLGGNRVIEALVVDWGWTGRRGKSARSLVMTSLDGQHWTDLHELINEERDHSIPRRVWFPQRVARYVRFTEMMWNGGNVYVRSLELYGPGCPLSSGTP